ncbi:MAG: AmmeMemoRadiSam system protein B [Candidatus Aminicenantes bacterium]|jgi:AmmeMemoRadiSam system protein B/AmmeMemoRadiSam system protein A
MKRKIQIFCVSFFIFIGLSWPQKTREAAVAGQFYDSRPAVLSKQINNYLKQAEGKGLKAEGLCALIVPHAGYVCSAPVAAYAYSSIQGIDIETVVIVGTCHSSRVRGCSVYPEGGYKTPLGVAQVDASLAQEISSLSGFKHIPSAHKTEHSVEVQVPFIQTVLPKAKIVPILVGAPTRNTITALADSLTKALRGKNVLVVASTDLSHYYAKEKANTVDLDTISRIQKLDTESLIQKLQRGENIMCGGGGVVATLLYAQNRGSAKVDILKYADSSMTCGPPSEVVGYLAAAVSVEDLSSEFSLSPEDKRELIQLARFSIESIIHERNVVNYTPKSPRLLVKSGAFVTLKKNGALRGCIGFVEPVAPLFQTVIQASIYAAVKDTRFHPVAPAELEGLEIEISVLTPIEKIADPKLVKIGTHGLLIAKNGRSGLLLPQVPVENNWSRTIFLEQACLKAGLPKTAWRSGAEIYVFEAIVVRE